MVSLYKTPMSHLKPNKTPVLIELPNELLEAVTRDRLRDDWIPPHRKDPKQPELF